MKQIHSIFHVVLYGLALAKLLSPVVANAQQPELLSSHSVIDFEPNAKILGADFAFQALLPAANGSSMPSEVESKTGGLYADADTWAQSLTLEWDWNQINSWVAYSFTGPTGHDAGIARNIFSQYWSNGLTSGTSVYLGKNQETVASLTTDWEVVGQAQRVKGTAGAVGDSFRMEWDLTRTIPLNYQRTKLLEVGTAGYDEWVRPNGVALLPGSMPTDGAPFSVHAIGFQTNFILPAKNLRFSFKYEPAYLRSAIAPSRIIIVGCSWTW